MDTSLLDLNVNWQPLFRNGYARLHHDDMQGIKPRTGNNNTREVTQCKHYEANGGRKGTKMKGETK